MATSNENPGLTATLARHVARVASSPLTEPDTEALRRLFLDNFVVSRWGSTRPAARQVAQWSRRFAGTGASPVLGGSWRTEPSAAALVHGTAAHSYELDDTHDVTTSHPGSVVIPAALAVAAETKATQEELFRATAAGYEAMALIGSTAGGLETVHRGFHPTAVFGTFGAATAALSLRAGSTVDPELLVAAWGHALSQASGSMQFSVEPTGGEVKRVHAGLGARNGVVAADFAVLDAVTAPRLALEGTYGTAASFGGPLREISLDGPLQIHTVSFKPYSCCRLFHSTIDALAEATDGFSRSPDSIAEILVTGPRLIAEQHMTEARSTMTAQYSCPYIVGATLAYGPHRYDAYGEEHLADKRILEIAGKVRFEVDSELEERYYPEHFATGVRITFDGGMTKSAMVADSVGTAARPMTTKQLLGKGSALGDGVASAMAAAIWDEANGGPELAAVLATD
ncbi:MmgE/PrpD family protein [Amycolatopsis sp. Poz14]|uniref:MmgE/PrpD family protein n=1 Tax=Amycolatopsis sp. Poz14 TaxID=1447705 RepID=UPI001EE7F775|nr:MmgE/PrpD family protein [Amycolatopsis sp. Poz14]MCG3754003.1 MmgE/PrpD family protein [Amycolatopsis sp. Poz14]